jgi:hypothetical protein
MSRPRTLAVLAVSFLLAGASCAPVYSNRPVGDKTVDPSSPLIAGIWCSSFWEENHLCFLVAALDPERGDFEVLPMREGAKASDARKLYLRECSTRNAPYFFVSEEDPALAGSYLWALGSWGISPLDHAPILFLWYTQDRREVFGDLVTKGLLPGRKLAEPKKGSSVQFGSTEQTLVLEGLTEKHCGLIIERRSELFDLRPGDMLQRLGGLAGFEADDHSNGLDPR